MTTSTASIPAPWTTRVRVAARIGWLALWVVLTAFAGFEVVKHGYLDGGAIDAIVLTVAAVGFFILPDLTFLIGIGETTEHGHLPVRTVPYYNALHRLWPPLALTVVVGVVFAPLSLGALAFFVGGLSWMAHVALDRATGFGLRNPDGSL